MGLHKIVKYAAYGLAIIGIIFGIMIMTGNDGMIDNMIYVGYATLLFILVLVLIYVIKGLFSGNVKKTLISVGLFAGILLISYAMSSGTDLDLEPFIQKGQDVTEATSKKVGAGLYAFYIIAIIAIGTMAFSGVKKLIK